MQKELPYEVLRLPWIEKALLRSVWTKQDLEENSRFLAQCICLHEDSVKLHGKYAFIRVLHAQEIVSSSFSLAAWALSLAYWRKTRSTYALLHGACWLSSFFFHVRDCWITQCLDYYFAFLCILSLTHFTVKLLYRERSFFIGRLLAAVFLAHVLYMTAVEFNFRYNMAMCGGFMSLNFFLLLSVYRKIKARQCSRLLLVFLHGILVASSFQVLDFGPMLFLVDSHSLWHILAFTYTWMLYELEAMIEGSANAQKALPGAP